MARRIKFKDNLGNDVEGTIIDITRTETPVSKIFLEDGTVLSSRPIFERVIRLDTPVDEQGNPAYHINLNAITTTSVAPGDLRINDGD